MTIPRFSPRHTKFKFNEKYDQEHSNEANTYREMYIEATWKHGSDIIFIEKEVIGIEPVFVETLGEIMKRGTCMRAFVEEVDSWAGAGDTFSKFGLRVGDECTVHIPKELFRRYRSTECDFFPKQGDLIYHMRSQKLFEITLIEDETSPSFYLFGNKVTYKFVCRAYNYEHSTINQDPDCGIPCEIKHLDGPQENARDIRNNQTPWVDEEIRIDAQDDQEKDPLA